MAKEAKALVIKLGKVLLCSFSERGKGSDCILLDDGDTNLDEFAQLGHDRFNIVDNDLLRGPFKEVRHSSASMSLDSWNGIAQHLSKSGKDRLVEGLLKFLSHIVCHLTNAMQRGVSDFRVRML